MSKGGLELLVIRTSEFFRHSGLVISHFAQHSKHWQIRNLKWHSVAC